MNTSLAVDTNPVTAPADATSPADLMTPSRYASRLLVHVGRNMQFVPTSTIDWIEANGNYVTLHVGRVTYSIRSTIGALADRLDPREFRRIHRSRIVNLSRVYQVRPWSNGDCIVVLHDGQELRMSRGHRAGLLEAFA